MPFVRGLHRPQAAAPGSGRRRIGSEGLPEDLHGYSHAHSLTRGRESTPAPAHPLPVLAARASYIHANESYVQETMRIHKTENMGSRNSSSLCCRHGFIKDTNNEECKERIQRSLFLFFFLSRSGGESSEMYERKKNPTACFIQAEILYDFFSFIRLRSFSSSDTTATSSKKKAESSPPLQISQVLPLARVRRGTE